MLNFLSIATQEDQPLPKDAADELKKQIESEGGNSQQVEVQATSSGRGII